MSDIASEGVEAPAPPDPDPATRPGPVTDLRGPESEDGPEPDADPDPAAGAPAPSESDQPTESHLPDPNPPGEPAPAAEFKLALVAGVTVTLPSQHPTVVLRETESPRRQLSFSIGLQDGMVLSHALRRIPTPRPLTHELVTGILQGFDIDVVAVRLVGRQGAVYFAELDLRGRSTRSVHACRPSDALCIALLQPVPVPILVDRRLFEQTGDITPVGAAPPPE